MCLYLPSRSHVFMYVFMYYLMYSCSMLCTLGMTMAYWKSHFKVAARFSTCRQGKKAILKRRAETIHSTKDEYKFTITMYKSMHREIVDQQTKIQYRINQRRYRINHRQYRRRLYRKRGIRGVRWRAPEKNFTDDEQRILSTQAENV